MANVGTGKRREDVKSKVLHAAAIMFLTQGYQNSTMKEIAKNAGVNYGSLFFAFKDKESLVCELANYVLDGQFNATAKFLEGKTEDKILFYAAETTLQLYMAESSEHIREMYSVAYSLPKSSEIICSTVAKKLENVFNEYLPHNEAKDFYELEIASGGIIRGFMTVPCDMYFTIDRKVKRFLETSLLVYRVPDEKINEAIEFVSQFDYKTIAETVINNLIAKLENNNNFVI